ncbi:alpha/beta hydrolase family protein [Asticcacaulis endophyticus]|uniref:Peptidase S9 n=1 Tax=Asticcacaulis endophyticus TaxID=1395890 RepID=A0A918UWV0_9CAUL|nr:prolyl oligopeptidase family serine peptidase [Asticcacaulis endophyticus]GGZ41450.1 peptidase S9 [Asticcacaulis endophyticus]
MAHKITNTLKGWQKVAYAVLAVSGSAYSGSTLAAPLPIEALSQYEAITNATISPDGKHVAAIVAAKGQKWPVISIWDANDLSKTPVWVPSQNMRIVGVDFIGNDRIFFITETAITGRDGRPTLTRKLYFTDLQGRSFEEPFRTAGTRNKAVREAEERGITVGIFNDDLYNPDLVLMEKADLDTGAQEIFEFNTKTAQTRLLAKGGEKTAFLSAGVDLATGEPLIKAEIEPVSNEFWYKVYIKDRGTGQWVYHAPLSYELKNRRNISPMGFDTDPSKLIVASNLNRNYQAIYSYDIKSQTFSAEPLFANDKFDVSGVGFKPDRAAKTSTISSITVNGPAAIQVILDEQWEPVQRSIKAAFPDKNVYINLNKDTRDSAIVTVEAPDLPPEYYLYKGGKLALLGKQRPWIDPKTLGKAEYITFKARDGLEIPAFVTYPPEWTPAKGPVPLVVMPHGGPWARDDLGWDGAGWTQFLATRGIAVVQPQYRGSDGWGYKLWTAGDKEWGQKMQDDKDDAAAYLVSKGVADPKRMAIFGYSYGGFAAIAASVRPNSPYKCAIAGAGVASLDRIGNLWGDNHLQRDVQGWTVTGMDPMKNVDKANIPIMLYHGDHDRQADTDHSRMFSKAMKAAGKDVEYYEIKGMWHTLPWRTEWHEETLGLIEGYLKSPKCGLM